MPGRQVGGVDDHIATGRQHAADLAKKPLGLHQVLQNVERRQNLDAPIAHWDALVGIGAQHADTVHFGRVRQPTVQLHAIDPLGAQNPGQRM